MLMLLKLQPMVAIFVKTRICRMVMKLQILANKFARTLFQECMDSLLTEFSWVVHLQGHLVSQFVAHTSAARRPYSKNIRSFDPGPESDWQRRCSKTNLL